MNKGPRIDRFCTTYDEVFQSQTFLDAVAYAVELQGETTQEDIKAIFNKIKNDEVLSDDESKCLSDILRRTSVLERAKVRFDEISKNRKFNGNARATDMSLDDLSDVQSFTKALLGTEHGFNRIIGEIKQKADSLAGSSS